MNWRSDSMQLVTESETEIWNLELLRWLGKDDKQRIVASSRGEKRHGCRTEFIRGRALPTQLDQFGVLKKWQKVATHWSCGAEQLQTIIGVTETVTVVCGHFPRSITCRKAETQASNSGYVKSVGLPHAIVFQCVHLVSPKLRFEIFH